MIPDYQTLMRSVLESCLHQEVSTTDVIEKLASEFSLSDEEKNSLLPSGKQATFSNRVHWAKSYLKQAGLLEYTRRNHFKITDAGQAALKSGEKIDNAYLLRFPSFIEFRSRTRSTNANSDSIEPESIDNPDATPDELIRKAHDQINDALAGELIDRILEANPAFFEGLIVDLLVAMGYGGTSEAPGRALGRSGDDGVDGVIDQDPLGVDQIYLQAKRYKRENNIGSGAIRDFFGSLSLKRAQKGIFVTTSAFSPAALQTARDLGSRIVLIDGSQLARLMIRYNVGCRDEQILHLKKVDEDYFE